MNIISRFITYTHIKKVDLLSYIFASFVWKMNQATRY